jgi:mono/diheme cytochrome c family protein
MGKAAFCMASKLVPEGVCCFTGDALARLRLTSSTWREGKRMRQIAVVAAVSTVLWIQPSVITWGQQTSGSLSANGAFTAEQAKNGERQYQSKCASCHGADLHSTEPEAPDLTEGAYKFGWQGMTVADRFETIRNTMPPGQAKSLDDQAYLDIVAYILQFNGMSPGTRRLTADMQVLQRMVITEP